MKNRLIYIIVSLVIVLGIVFYFSKMSPKKSATDFFGVTITNTTSSANSTTNTVGDLPPVQYTNVSMHSYKNTAYHFSTEVPKDVTPSEFDDDNGHNILIQNKTYQMQIYVSAFDEDITLTKERIAQDIPDLQMESPNAVTMNGVTGVAFISNEDGQKYREVWIVYKGNLYQTLSPVSQDSMTSTILQSWRWL